MNIQIANLRDYKTKKAFNNAMAGFVRVDRQSVLGNPFFMQNESQREEVCIKYKRWLWYHRNDQHIKQELERLFAIAKKMSLTLCCWCSPKRCHAETIKDYLIWMEQNE